MTYRHYSNHIDNKAFDNTHRTPTMLISMLKYVSITPRPTMMSNILCYDEFQRHLIDKCLNELIIGKMFIHGYFSPV